LPITVPVMTSKCHDVITGMVTGPITIPVIFRSVTMSFIIKRT
jgi:hypothetical protein